MMEETVVDQLESRGFEAAWASLVDELDIPAELLHQIRTGWVSYQDVLAAYIEQTAAAAEVLTVWLKQGQVTMTERGEVQPCDGGSSGRSREYGRCVRCVDGTGGSP